MVEVAATFFKKKAKHPKLFYFEEYIWWTICRYSPSPEEKTSAKTKQTLTELNSCLPAIVRGLFRIYQTWMFERYRNMLPLVKKKWKFKTKISKDLDRRNLDRLAYVIYCSLPPFPKLCFQHPRVETCSESSQTFIMEFGARCLFRFSVSLKRNYLTDKGMTRTTSFIYGTL